VKQKEAKTSEEITPRFHHSLFLRSKRFQLVYGFRDAVPDQ